MKILFACSLLAGCALPSDPDSLPDAEGGDVSPGPSAPVVAGGTYRVRSQIDVTAEAVLPEPAEEMVVTLRDFSMHPGHTLIDLADQAGVPAVSELRALLPDLLESRLDGWLDDEIANIRISGVPVTQLAGDAAALAATALTRFELDSEFRIDGASATHQLTAIDFAPAGLDTRLGFPAGISAAAPAASHAGSLSIGDHRFGLAYGEYVWQATDAVITQRFGAGIRAVLGSAIDCPRLAQAIASRCVLGVCVGHASLLDELCERGLDEVVRIAHDRVAALRFDVLRFATGEARLADTSGDGIADALTGGVWTAEINAGVGLRPVPATFSASR
ncbi:MAG TPA: hypothetical protein VHN14_16460 [Kofleriaceae bacterium]|jgi:hypothetical protein|nr:hypothetical protein [Kofleriaceae bacterium]